MTAVGIGRLRAVGGRQVRVGRLGISGQFFTMDGQPFTIIETSEFSLFKRYLDGDVILAVLAQRAQLGFNMQRVWLLNTSVVGYRHVNWRTYHGPPPSDGIHPDQYPDFYERLGVFVDLVGSYGLCLELTVFTSTQSLMPNRDAQQRHLDATAEAVRGKGHVILELVNENDQHDNATDPNLRRPAGVIISRGSNGSDSVPPRHDSPWDYELYHTNGLPEFQRKVGHNAAEWAGQSKKPCISNENTRYPDDERSVAHAHDAAMGGAFFCAGSCYHSQAGKLSNLFEDDELPFASAWATGAASVPLEFQNGAYAHRVDLEPAEWKGSGRVYSKRLGDGREYVIRIAP